MTSGGRQVDAWTLVNWRGTTLSAITLGATITALEVPDRQGHRENVVLSMPDVEGYLRRAPYFGAVVGRYANRIAGGRFTLDGTGYVLPANASPHHLHGGIAGFDKRLWCAQRVRHTLGPAVRFSLTSPDGDQGYPGTLRVTVRYLLTHDDHLVIDYTATSTRATVVNLTQHSYFNLAGSRHADVLGHELAVHADYFTPVDATLMPTGDVAPVEGTPFDFRVPTPIGARLKEDNKQLRHGHGYDHNFVVRGGGARMAPAASVHEPRSGRTMEVWTTEPGLQLYTGNGLDGSLVTADGRRCGPHAGFCLETQRFPDSPNQPHFPSAVLRRGERYQSRTAWVFGTRD